MLAVDMTRSALRGLTVTRQVGADSAARRGERPAGASQPLIALCPPIGRQHDMEARCVPATMLSSTGMTDRAQAGASAGALTQRMLTRATADTGKSDCTNISRTQKSQPVFCKYRPIALYCTILLLKTFQSLRKKSQRGICWTLWKKRRWKSRRSCHAAEINSSLLPRGGFTTGGIGDLGGGQEAAYSQNPAGVNSILLIRR